MLFQLQGQWILLFTKPENIFKSCIRPMLEEAREGMDRHTFRDIFLSIYCRLEGMKTETEFLLGLGVPELGWGMETVIFG